MITEILAATLVILALALLYYSISKEIQESKENDPDDIYREH